MTQAPESPAPAGFDDGGPAFATTYDAGMSKFEFFTGEALKGLLAAAEPSDEWTDEDISGLTNLACDFGEAMLTSIKSRVQS